MRINQWRNILFVATAGLFILYIVWWGRMIGDPVERSSTDFIHFYSVGRIAQLHGFTSMYDIEYQKSIEQEVVGFPLADKQVLLYNHMPYLVPLLRLVVDSNYVGSFERWVLILIVIYLFGTQFLIKSLFDVGRKDVDFALFMGTLTFLPLFVSLWQGQDTAFLYLGAIFWYVGILKKRDWLIALGLALVTIRPHIAIALAIPLFFKNQRAWWRSILLISILALVSVALLKPQGAFEFVNLLRITSEGTWFGMRPATMLNILGFVLRVVQVQNSSIVSGIGWLIYLAGMVTICGLWYRTRMIDGRVLGLSIVIAVLTAPVLHLHDLTVLIIPLIFIAHDRSVRFSEPLWALLPTGASLVLLIGIVLDALFFILPYVLFVLIGWLLIDRQRNVLTASVHDAE